MRSALEIVNFMSILVLSTACHESAHARLADRFGDDTPRMAGRISWNPFVHVHPIYTVALPAILFATTGSILAAAFTPVNPSKMRKPRLHSLLVSLGGPATNILLAVLFFVVLSIYVLAIGGYDAHSHSREMNLLNVLYMAVQMNIFLALLNFLPFPPLDGSYLVEFLLPARLRWHWIEFRNHAWMVLLILMVTGVLDMVLGPATRAAGDVVDLCLDFVNGYARRG